MSHDVVKWVRTIAATERSSDYVYLFGIAACCASTGFEFLPGPSPTAEARVAVCRDCWDHAFHRIIQDEMVSYDYRRRLYNQLRRY